MFSYFFTPPPVYTRVFQQVFQICQYDYTCMFFESGVRYPPVMMMILLLCIVIIWASSRVVISVLESVVAIFKIAANHASNKEFMSYIIVLSGVTYVYWMVHYALTFFVERLITRALRMQPLHE